MNLMSADGRRVRLAVRRLEFASSRVRDRRRFVFWFDASELVAATNPKRRREKVNESVTTSATHSKTTSPDALTASGLVGGLLGLARGLSANCNERAAPAFSNTGGAKLDAGQPHMRPATLRPQPPHLI